MPPRPSESLSRRERQIMEIVYALGEASAAQVREGLADAPSYSAVRALLRILEDKGHLRHRADGARYVYLPVRPRRQAARAALRGLMRTFFEDSPAQAVAAILDASEARIGEEELQRLSELIEQARREGR